MASLVNKLQRASYVWKYWYNYFHDHPQEN